MSNCVAEKNFRSLSGKLDDRGRSDEEGASSTELPKKTFWKHRERRR